MHGRAVRMMDGGSTMTTHHIAAALAGLLMIGCADDLPVPRVTVTAVDAQGEVMETVGAVAETGQLHFQMAGVGALRFIDNGGDGHLIDDLTFTLQDDLDGDGVPNSLDKCPA